MGKPLPRYHLCRLEPFAKGGEAVILHAVDRTTKQHVAIRRLKHSFEDGFAAKRAIREVLFMKLCKHDNIVKLIDIFITPNPEWFTQGKLELAIVMPKKDYSLRYFNEKRSHWIGDSFWSIVQRIFYGILSGVEYMHLNGIIHRDLTINNVVVDDNCNATIIDFGLSRLLTSNAKITENPTKLGYQAPEAYTSNYTEKVDLWSIGCLFIELITGIPFLSVTQTTQAEQLRSIISLYKHDPTFVDMFLTVVPSQYWPRLENTQATTLRDVYPLNQWPANETNLSATRENAMDLLEMLLQFNPDERPTASEALMSPFFGDYHHQTVVPETRIVDDPHVRSLFDAIDHFGNETAFNDFYIDALKQVLNDYNVEEKPICMHLDFETCVHCK